MLLELMPAVTEEYYRDSTITPRELAQKIDDLREAIVALLRDIGIDTAFDAKGALVRTDVDSGNVRLLKLQGSPATQLTSLRASGLRPHMTSETQPRYWLRAMTRCTLRKRSMAQIK